MQKAHRKTLLAYNRVLLFITYIYIIYIYIYKIIYIIIIICNNIAIYLDLCWFFYKFTLEVLTQSQGGGRMLVESE